MCAGTADAVTCVTMCVWRVRVLVLEWRVEAVAGGAQEPPRQPHEAASLRAHTNYFSCIFWKREAADEYEL